MSKKLVAITIVAIFVGILVWDAFLYSDDVARNSITQVIIDLSKQSALVPWFFGMVMGFLGAHLFDSSEQETPEDVTILDGAEIVCSCGNRMRFRVRSQDGHLSGADYPRAKV